MLRAALAHEHEGAHGDRDGFGSLCVSAEADGEKSQACAQ
jgi:hypothetical protein